MRQHVGIQRPSEIELLPKRAIIDQSANQLKTGVAAPFGWRLTAL
jgi:hypothetical protein